MVHNSILFFLLITHLCSSSSSSAVPTNIDIYCPNTDTYPPDPNPNPNLDALLDNLISATTTNSPPLFYNSSVVGTPSVYGLYLCRGDLTTCRDCVVAATANLKKTCQSAWKGGAWYDECMVRYSNSPTFRKMDDSVNRTEYNVDTFAGDQSLFNDSLNAAISTVSRKASRGTQLLKFATDERNLGGRMNIYVMGQCTPDLSEVDCYRCLQTCDQRIHDRARQGGMVLLYSCFLRYEIYSYLQKAAPAPAPVLAPVLHFPPTKSAPDRILGNKSKKSSSKLVTGAVAGAASAGLLLVALLICLVIRKRENKNAKASDAADASATDELTSAESLQYGFNTLQAATNNFSDDKKIGEGGFGSVYEAMLPNGEEVAIKRLSMSSCQGAQEFKNEVVIVANLQHRNLVRLLGFCLIGLEKLLVYEYVPNNSLNSFLFDPARRGELNWPRRLKIIIGIVRGMLYLHEDSRVRIIHRDLKASNVLLDNDMNSKISDFGMAKIFGTDETHGNTSRVAGTFGYMAPEYALHGQFSVKSDVYSFGVLILEIISGKRITNFNESGYADDLLYYAWKLWNEGTPMELVDSIMRDSCSSSEVIRCIHIGLLCVQDDIDQRPTMASIMLMLSNHSMSMSAPQQRAFSIQGDKTSSSISSTDRSRSKSVPVSLNGSSITELHPR